MADNSDGPARGPAAPTPTSRRLPPAGRIWVLAGALLVAAVAWTVHRGTSAAPGPASAAAAQARPVPVVAATVTRRDVPTVLEGLGSVVAYRTVTVRPLVDGRLDQALFREGQAVAAGQVLAQIDPRPFQIQLQQAEGALARDDAQLESARRDLERYRTLITRQLIAQQQVDAQVATVGQLEGTVRVDQAAVASARLNLDYARITSPVAGVTGIRQVDPGNVVHAADPGGIVLVTQLDPIAVIFTLPQDHLPAVAEAMARGALPVQVFGRDGPAPLGSGRLELVDNQINPATSTIRLKAVLPNPRHLLWPNQFVKARLELGVEKGALVLPAAALQRGPGGSFVYLIGADETVSPRPVEVASSAGEQALIARGLAEGDRVVVEGQAALRSGSKVAVSQAGQPPGGSGGQPGGAAAGQRAVREAVTP